MARRIVTARQQCELLSPWRTAERADRVEWERSFDGGGGWILVTRTPDGNPVTVATSPTRGQRSSALQQRPPRQGELPYDHRDDEPLWQRPHGLPEDFDPFGDLDGSARHASHASDDYRGVHKAPGPHTGIPVHDMNGSDADGGVPEDWYTHPHYYSHGEVSDRERGRVQHMYNQARGNPDHPVTVYRALPTGRTQFNTGDWVTPSLEYAQGHAIQDDDPANDWPVISTTVPAKHLWGNGDSYYEMGYHGPHTEGKLA